MVTKESPFIPIDESLYPVHPSVFEETKSQIKLNPVGIYNEEIEELNQAQPHIIDLLGELDLIDLVDDPRGSDEVFKGASYAYRLFKNQVKLQNQSIPLIPRAIVDSVIADYEEYKRKIKIKNQHMRAEFVFENKIKTPQEEFFAGLLEISRIGLQQFTFKRKQGVIVVAYLFKTYQEVTELNAQF